MLRQVLKVPAEQKAAFDRWYDEQGFEVVDEITDRCYDAAIELLAAASDYIKYRKMDASDPTFAEILEQAQSWLTEVDYGGAAASYPASGK